MRHTHIAALAAAALLTLAGCTGDDSSTDAKPTPAASKTRTAAPTELPDDVKASIAEKLGYPPEADAATERRYRAALDAIDPDIAHGKTDKAVSRGRDTCRAYKETHKGKPADRAKLIALTNLRFTSPNHPEGHGLATAAKILDAVHKHLCPDF